MSGKKATNKAAVDRFVGYFADQLRQIGGLESHHYRKTLFVAVVDTLSLAAVPQLKDKNRDRFLGFVDGWGDWPERGRVSLPQLLGNLAREKVLAEGRLGAEVRQRLKAWQDGRIYHAADDPAKNELLEFAADEGEQQLIERHTHLSLLWVYRNVLVHEFREAGYDMGVLGDDPTPYYMMHGAEGVSRWELAYPTTFFAALASRSLANLKNHLEANDLDPYTFYEFGSIWKQIALKRPWHESRVSGAKARRRAQSRRTKNPVMLIAARTRQQEGAMRYRIEQRIETLAENAVMKDGRMEAAFSVGPVRYSHWDFDLSRGWPSDFWLAEASIEADDYKAAFGIFRQELNRVISRISLISQAYIDFLQQPMLIAKDGEQVGFLRYLRKKPGVGLMFVEDHREALVRLLEDASIPEEFYYYCNDVVNAVGYTPKLLLMCAAIESLTRAGHGKKDWEKVVRVLGGELKEDLYGTKEDSSTGLRHRLSHGEYFGVDHSGKDYVELIHKKVMAYFNDHILNERLLELNVVSPQRHFVGGLEGGSWFIKSKGPDGLSLKRILLDFETNDVNSLEHHELVYDGSLETTY